MRKIVLGLGISLDGYIARLNGKVDFLFTPKDYSMAPFFATMEGMIGSYIAALTAFSAVNLTRWFGAAWWVWLWPTIVGVPAIGIWKAYYEKKFSPASKAAAG
jgi:hypothetical protein